MIFILYLIVGIFAGLFSGMLGIGGGIIVVPALIFIFKNTIFFTNDLIIHIAVATSLATMIFTTSSSAFAYNKRSLINWKIFGKFFPGLCCGLFFGSLISIYISSDKLIISFALFLATIAIYLFFYKKNAISSNELSLENKKSFLILFSIIIGFLASTFGIGGGILIVPFFLSIGMNIRNASGTSSICAVPIAILGTILFTIIGWNEVNKPGAFGFIYWPAALIISCTSMLAAPLGVRIAGCCNPLILQRIFSVILIITAINLFSNSLHL